MRLVFRIAIGEFGVVRIHRGEHFLARLVGLAHEAAEQRAFVIGVEGGERRRELLRTILVGALQLLPQAPEEPSDSAILGERDRARARALRGLGSSRPGAGSQETLTSPSLSVGLSFLNSGLDSPT